MKSLYALSDVGSSSGEEGSVFEAEEEDAAGSVEKKKRKRKEDGESEVLTEDDDEEEEEEIPLASIVTKGRAVKSPKKGKSLSSSSRLSEATKKRLLEAAGRDDESQGGRKGKGKAKGKWVKPDEEDEGSEFEASDLTDLSDMDDSDLGLEDESILPPVQKKRRSPKKGGKGKDKALNPIDAEFRQSLKGQPHWYKTQLLLERHHPELREVWGDLSTKVKVNEPIKAPQPAGLKAKLLPFQLEGLGWMLKQETGPWSGGMLADEMGMGKTIRE